MDCQRIHGGGGSIVQALNTHVYGNGTQTLVLAHGYGSDQTVWHYLIPILACYFKVVVFDLVFSPNLHPKLYDSKRYSSNFNAYAEDLLCLLDALNVKKTIYIRVIPCLPWLDALLLLKDQTFSSTSFC
jgi:pimeloyl-ACP methyl ester carboxylesterase